MLTFGSKIYRFVDHTWMLWENHVGKIVVMWMTNEEYDAKKSDKKQPSQLSRF